jgi:hypothetical protein
VQLSAAVGSVQTGTTPQALGTGTGSGAVGQSITGGTTSFTETLKEQVDVFPEESVAVYTTTVSPVVNTEPDGMFGTKTTPPKPQLSETVGGVQLRMVSHLFTGRITRIGKDGQLVNRGLVLSVTVTVKVQVVVLPKSSVAVKTTVCGEFATSKNDPEAGIATMATFWSQLSVAIGATHV